MDNQGGFVVRVTPDLVTRGIHAGELAKIIGKVLDGGGGGRADKAEGGTKAMKRWDDAEIQQIIMDYLHMKLALEVRDG